MQRVWITSQSHRGATIVERMDPADLWPLPQRRINQECRRRSVHFILMVMEALVFTCCTDLKVLIHRNRCFYAVAPDGLSKPCSLSYSSLRDCFRTCAVLHRTILSVSRASRKRICRA
jgi:hypothetical protein